MKKSLKNKSISNELNSFKEELIEEFKNLIKNKKFPEDYIPYVNFEAEDSFIHSTNGKELYIETFFEKYELKDKNGVIFLIVDDEKTAIYARLCSRSGDKTIRIPKNYSILSLAIENFESEIENVTCLIKKRIASRINNQYSASRLFAELKEELGL